MHARWGRHLCWPARNGYLPLSWGVDYIYPNYESDKAIYRSREMRGKAFIKTMHRGTLSRQLEVFPATSYAAIRPSAGRCKAVLSGRLWFKSSREEPICRTASKCSALFLNCQRYLKLKLLITLNMRALVCCNKHLKS